MMNLADTIARLRSLHPSVMPGMAEPDDGRLSALKDFGANPGALKAWRFVPDQLRAKSPLVVALHGCTQTAKAYDVGAGWSELAERHGFALLLPEQQRANNPNLCFNWFQKGDATRDEGEALSIRNMIDRMIADHDLDRRRVYVTGLSAGGAMTSIMLASYPELFAGGGVIAGLPYGVAGSALEAFDRMLNPIGRSSEELQQLLRGASKHARDWPIVSIWHGAADQTVNPSNGEAIIDQWRSVHRVEATPTREETVHGSARRVWSDPSGRDVLEHHSIPRMGHGVPLKTQGDGAGGKVGPYMLEAGVNSSAMIAKFWGIAEPSRRATARTAPASEEPTPRKVKPALLGVAASVKKTIEDALRAAGLLK